MYVYIYIYIYISIYIYIYIYSHTHMCGTESPPVPSPLRGELHQKGDSDDSSDFKPHAW